MSDAALSGEELTRIAEALERLSPPSAEVPQFDVANAFLWHASPDRLQPVPDVKRVALELLIGIDRARDALLANTEQFAKGYAANNAMI